MQNQTVYVSFDKGLFKNKLLKAECKWREFFWALASSSLIQSAGPSEQS